MNLVFEAQLTFKKTTGPHSSSPCRERSAEESNRGGFWC